MLVMVASLSTAGSCYLSGIDPNFKCTGVRNGTDGINGNLSVNWGTLFSPAMNGNPSTGQAFWAAYAKDNLTSQNVELLTINGLAGTSTFSRAVQADANGNNGSWQGAFSQGDNLLRNTNPGAGTSDYIDIQAIPGAGGVYALGFQLQSLLNEGGPPFGFTASVYVFGDPHVFTEDNGTSTGTVPSEQLLGFYSVSVDDGSGNNGTGPFDVNMNDTNADNSAPFLGVFTSVPISSVLIAEDSGDAGFNDFAINQIDLVETSSDTGSSDVPEPGTLLLLGSGVVVVFRRRH